MEGASQFTSELQTREQKRMIYRHLQADLKSVGRFPDQKETCSGEA